MEEVEIKVKSVLSSSEIVLFPDSDIFEEILWNLLYSTEPSTTLRCEQLLSQLTVAYRMDCADVARVFHSIAYETYMQKNVDFAEYCFRKACRLCDDDSYNNNLAYTLRRHHKMDASTKAEIISLLLPGVKKNESFSMVNMALLFADKLGLESDWEIADDLIKNLVEPISGIEAWWKELAVSGEAEGYLIILWLLRHNKISSSELGTYHDLSIKVKSEYPHAPGWLFDKIVDASSQLDDCTNV